MINCDHLTHPFQNDPGTSQGERVDDNLLSGKSKIDGRTLADLLDYFSQLSRHINFYDPQLKVSDWQTFFIKSIPFALSGIVKYNAELKSDKFALYNALFKKFPSKSGLQLILYFFYYTTIYRFNYWHIQFKGSGLPIESTIEKLIKDRLREPLKTFIYLMNTSSKWSGVKRIDFTKVLQNDVWGLEITDLYSADICLGSKIKGKQKQLRYLQAEVERIFPSFNESTRILSTGAESSLELSLFSMKEDMQKKHSPHLGLLFSFLKLFQHLQLDLNGFSKKHLDFFYKEVIQLTPKQATPDSAHLLFEIQKNLKKYLLKKGTVLKDGKDNNKAEVLFELDDEIIINKTQVAEIKTLFLKNEAIYENGYLEGLYCAPKANAADGIEKEFKDSDPKNYPTLGNKYSKYIKEGRNESNPYPSARIGFILASPVFFLNEGTRTIDISLACELNEDICNEKFPSEAVDKSCCGPSAISNLEKPKYPDQIPAIQLFDEVKNVLQKSYYFVSEELINETIKKGIKEETAFSIKELFLVDPCKKPICSEDQKYYLNGNVVEASEWKSKFYNARNEGEKEILDQIFIERRPFNALFSGEQEWIEPSSYSPPIMNQLSATQFSLQFSFTLNPDKPAVTFYNPENLKEEFSTTLPLVKFELDDFVKINLDQKLKARLGIEDNSDCCLHNKENECDRSISLYQFFRKVIVGEGTTINVNVCGLKNFVVQNDESVQNVNAPIYPFGTRPEVAGFDLINPIGGNLIGPNFYIGSQEVFGKKWDEVYINLDWKDKPSDFNEYYKAYWVDPDDQTNFGLTEESFQVNLSVLQDGRWKKESLHGFPPIPFTIQNATTLDNNRELFRNNASADFCDGQNTKTTQTIYLNKEHLPGLVQRYKIDDPLNKIFTVDSKDGFLRINLQNQDFMHKNYAFILARQMMALGQYPNKGFEGAVYLGSGNALIVFKETGQQIAALKTLLTDAANKAGLTKVEADLIAVRLLEVVQAASDGGTNITQNEINTILNPVIDNTSTFAGQTKIIMDAVVLAVNLLQVHLQIFKPDGTLVEDLSVPIPNKPWTPIIKRMNIDYSASAVLEDIELIHLYPFIGTHKKEEIRIMPSLLPTHCDEGSLFLGLTDLEPGSNINILFQLAEATADSEAQREEIFWQFLDNNQWKNLRKGFEILSDATNGLTSSGIINMALPETISRGNTILPSGFHWIKAAIPKNSSTISETIGIHTQAVKATFQIQPENDLLRMAQTSAANSISKLKVADSSVKKVSQPYETFGGEVPEGEGGYYLRVSELLRHKGRAIQKYDYERLALEAFPALFKVKCINHSYALDAQVYKNDFPVAPGYVILAVIPDLNILKAGNSFAPKAPLSLIEQVETYFKRRNSPFVRLSVMNPRYEKVNFCLKVKLYYGKDENYYKEKLKEDLKEFLAPWSTGEFDKLTFGQPVTKSNVVGFLETRDYVDYIIEMRMGHESEVPKEQFEVLPLTPRSILIGGEIEVCVCQNDCEQWYNEEKCENRPELIVNYCNEVEQPD